MSDDKEDFTEATARMLDGVWKIAAELGFCPICMVELMADMVADAEDKGLIGHMNAPPDDDDDDEPEPTHEGPRTPQ
jgi:phage terminase small subunit